jgi:hypothetical protein
MFGFGTLKLTANQSAFNGEFMAPPLEQHRRETFLWIVLPMVGSLVLVVAGVAAAMLLRQPAQVSILADWMGMFVLLCPLVLCLLPLAVVFITAAVWMNQVHRKTKRLMVKAELMSLSLAERTHKVTETVSKQSIGFNARIAFLDPLWRMFDRKEDSNGKPNP